MAEICISALLAPVSSPLQLNGKSQERERARAVKFEIQISVIMDRGRFFLFVGAALSVISRQTWLDDCRCVPNRK